MTLIYTHAGVPGHNRLKKKLSLDQMRIEEDEIEYYKNKNKELYQAQARAQKMTMKKYVQNAHIQPSFDDNLEFESNNNNNVGLSEDLKVPIYR